MELGTVFVSSLRGQPSPTISSVGKPVFSWSPLSLNLVYWRPFQGKRGEFCAMGTCQTYVVWCQPQGGPGLCSRESFRLCFPVPGCSAGVSGAVRGRGLRLGDGSFGWTVSPHPAHLALPSWPCGSDPPHHQRRGHTTWACTHILTPHTPALRRVPMLQHQLCTCVGHTHTPSGTCTPRSSLRRKLACCCSSGGFT